MAEPIPVHGSKGAVYMSSTKAGAPALLMKITDFTLDMKTDKVETTGLQDVNKTYLQGLKDIQGTITGYYLADDDTLFDAAESPDGMQLYLYPNLPAGAWWGGPAWLDVSIKVAVGDTVKVDGNFSANGAWSRSGGAGTLSRKLDRGVGAPITGMPLP